jgi:predicted RNase H-like HicB family nuclease
MRMKKSSSRRITIDAIIKRDRDGVYFGVVPELPGCHTEARSLDELSLRLKEAIRLYLQADKNFHADSQFIGIHQIEVAL